MKVRTEVSPSVPSCRSGCAACCIAPSISSSIPGMPFGKPAGVRCVQLSVDDSCLLFDRPERPSVCVSLRATAEMCGGSREEALAGLALLERLTRPGEPAMDVDSKANPGAGRDLPGR